MPKNNPLPTKEEAVRLLKLFFDSQQLQLKISLGQSKILTEILKVLKENK